MAYPGQKNDRTEELRLLNLPSARYVVDAFYGSGGLSNSYVQTYPENVRYRIAGEAFGPLRSLYTAKIDLEKLSKEFMKDVCDRGKAIVWEDLRDSLNYESLSYHDYEAFLILNNIGHGNSMRHSKGRHNIKFADEKYEGLQKRGSLIDPIALRPTLIYANWQSAIMAAQGIEAIALLDPPYLKSDSIYPGENPTDCAVPPVKLAMQRGYGAIIAYNSPSDELDFWFAGAAAQYGYSCDRHDTTWKTKFSARSAGKQGKEQLWIFRRVDPQ